MILWSNVKIEPPLSRALDLTDMMMLWFKLPTQEKYVNISMDYCLLWLIYYLTKSICEVEKTQLFYKLEKMQLTTEMWIKTSLCIWTWFHYLQLKIHMNERCDLSFSIVSACLLIWLSFGYLLCHWFWLQLISE